MANVCMPAKLLQLCLTLCDPIDSSPPGSSVPGILQARILEWVAISFSRAMHQFSSVAQSRPTLCDPMNHSMAGLPVHHQILEFTQAHVHLVGDAIQPSHPLLPPSPPAPNPFQHQGLFQWVNSSREVAISPSNEHPGLVSFRMDWLDLLAVQGTLKSLLQHHSSETSILQCSAFFTGHA